MCVSTGPAVSRVTDTDTSKDPIVSNYELTEAQKKENARRRAAKKSKSLVSFSDDGNTGTGVSFSGSVPSSRGFSTEQATGFGMNL
jgi:hypothetical protein